jgi:hypothetical protein
MGQYVKNVSMFGADLSDDEQAAKYIGKHGISAETVIKKIQAEMYKIFSRYFQIEKFLGNHQEKGNHLKQLTSMHKVVVSIQNSFVNGAETIQ